jgi:opacity protein-like surface antigen
MKHMLQVAALALFATHAGIASAKSSPRAGTWEFTLQGQYADSVDIDVDTETRADVEGFWGLGFGFAYNFNDHFSLGGEFTWGEADYSATVAPAPGNPGSAYSISTELESSTVRVNGTWNILAAPLTPFVTGGVGATYVDTNIPDGPPSTSCWYDPWWGYFCGTSVPTKDDTYFSYMVGAGLRWDAPRSFFLRGLVGRQWVDVGNGVGTPGITQFRIDFGWRF